MSKIDSNITGLRYAVQAGVKQLSANAIWHPLEPNGYTDFGGQITTMARNPINPSRQRKKGVTTDLDASAGFGQDLTQNGLTRLMQGFVFAEMREKATNLSINEDYTTFTQVDAATKTYTLKDGEIGADFAADDLVYFSGFTQATNNGLKTVVSTTDTTIVVAEVCVDEGDATAATGTLTLTAAVNGNTVEIGGYTYTFKTVLEDAGDVDVGDGGAEARANLIAAINGTGTEGLEYAAGTAASQFVVASGDITLTAKIAGLIGNSITTVATLETGSFAAATLTGGDGVDIVQAKAQKVGYEFAATELSVNVASSYPRFVSSGKDLTEFGLVAGEWIYVGGDAEDSYFAKDVSNGFFRVRAVTDTYIEIDKSAGDCEADAGTGKAIQLFFGDVVKNEAEPDLIKRQIYQLERTLGQDTDGTMSEYIIDAVPNEMTLEVRQADKVTVNLGFIGTDNEQRTGLQGTKTGYRPSLVDSAAYNTSDDFSRIKMHLVVDGESNPAPLFAYLTEMTLTINNNVSPNKAIAVLGAFDLTAGTFEVGGNVTAYFADIASVMAVRQNADVTLDFSLVKNNAGIVWDLPLLALGEGRLSVEQDQPITLPLELMAAEGAQGHTLLVNFFAYLPNRAE